MGTLIWKKKCGFEWKEGEPVEIFKAMDEYSKTHVHISVVNEEHTQIGSWRAKQGDDLETLCTHFEKKKGFKNFRNNLIQNYLTSIKNKKLKQQQQKPHQPPNMTPPTTT